MLPGSNRPGSLSRRNGMLHYHRCWRCSAIWGHACEAYNSEEAHRCPECGEDQWEFYFPTEAEQEMVAQREDVR